MLSRDACHRPQSLIGCSIHPFTGAGNSNAEMLSLGWFVPLAETGAGLTALYQLESNAADLAFYSISDKFRLAFNLFI